MSRARDKKKVISVEKDAVTHLTKHSNFKQRRLIQMRTNAFLFKINNCREIKKSRIERNMFKDLFKKSKL